MIPEKLTLFFSNAVHLCCACEGLHVLNRGQIAKCTIAPIRYRGLEYWWGLVAAQVLHERDLCHRPAGRPMRESACRLEKRPSMTVDLGACRVATER